MKKLSIVLLCFVSASAFSQKVKSDFNLHRPKLVVGIMIDQMRWDYLYRYYKDYSDHGAFKRLLAGGYSCENTLIPYAQTVTAAGHTSVYTGSTPAFNGIVGNEWYDKKLDRVVYCAEDKDVKIIGGAPDAAPMSPKNLWSTTITDELRLATNFKSKVVGVAIKDRASIFPSGHSANAAYWYDDKSGNWVTSTYYMNDLPKWVKQFNSRNVVDSFYKLNWNPLTALSNYDQSDKDNSSYEGVSSLQPSIVFPHKTEDQIGKNYSVIRATPFGNTMTLMFAKKAIEEEKLGNNAATDFLDVSLSSTDVIGHQFGPNSIETEDTYRRLDLDLGNFLSYLDAKVGAGNYLIFLTADHGASQAPGFLNEHKIPANALSTRVKELNKAVESEFGVSNLIAGVYVYQLYLNDHRIDSAGIKKEDVKEFLIDYLNKQDDIYLAYDTKYISVVNLPEAIKEKFFKGFNPKRGGDIQIILKPQNYFGGSTGTQHGVWYPYDAHIPLLFYGWRIKPGQLNREVYMTDIAATVAALLHIQMPSGCIGKPIFELIK